MIKIAMIGKSEGNGHPYSWSSIINGGYNEDKMKNQPFKEIYNYLSKEPKENFGFDGVKVTHIWTENKKDAEDIAACSFIDNIVDNPEDVIGCVDAVIIAEDIGSTHLKLALPYIEKNIPILIDKPLTDNESDLKQFVKYLMNGKKIMSSSGFGNTKELENIGEYDLGEILYVGCIMLKSWESYGIHAVAGICSILGPEIESVLNLGKDKAESIYLNYRNNKQAIVSQIYSAGMVRFDIVGSKGTRIITQFDSFYMFKKQLGKFIYLIKTGKYPYPWQDTINQIKVLIAAIKSRRSGGKKIIIE